MVSVICNLVLFYTFSLIFCHRTQSTAHFLPSTTKWNRQQNEKSDGPKRTWKGNQPTHVSHPCNIFFIFFRYVMFTSSFMFSFVSSFQFCRIDTRPSHYPHPSFKRKKNNKENINYYKLNLTKGSIEHIWLGLLCYPSVYLFSVHQGYRSVYYISRTIRPYFNLCIKNSYVNWQT